MSRAAKEGSRLALVGDIGGTNARFGLVDLDAERLVVTAAARYRVKDHANAAAAVQLYLREQGLTCALAGAAVAVAGPVTNGAIDFTNSNWTLSEAELRSLGFGSARLLNDYAALAIAAPILEGDDLRMIGEGGQGLANRTIAIIGPGTGFGVSALARDDHGAATVTTEGGHVSFAPTDDVEIEILRLLARRYGRVSVERILSGAGLHDLHQCLQAIEGRPTTDDDPAEITRRALADDPECLRTVERFCAILGSVAGDFALSFGALGGVYIAGGIPPLIISVLERSAFRQRFEAKGRFGDYLRGIPTPVIMRPHVALLGAAQSIRTLLKDQ
ncbi:MAG: glucokinase [Caulobacter sp.]|nr:glucokinase [Caulobacter sp.]